MQPINVYGDHATCCAKNGDLVIRHNAIRNLVYSIASDGLLKPVLEKQGILGPTTGRRPGDVSVPDWKNHNGLAIDVAVTSPLTKGSLRLVSPCEDYATVQKHRKYDESFKGTNFFFCAMVFETWMLSMTRVRRSCDSCSLSQRSIWGVSSVLTAVAVGRASRVACSARLRK